MSPRPGSVAQHDAKTPGKAQSPLISTGPSHQLRILFQASDQLISALQHLLEGIADGLDAGCVRSVADALLICRIVSSFQSLTSSANSPHPG